MAVEANGEARCCKPADCNHRAMTASPASVAGPAALCRDPGPAWSYRAVAEALLCCIWPPMWRCDRLWGANFQDLFSHGWGENWKPKKNMKERSERTESKSASPGIRVKGVIECGESRSAV